MMNAPFKMFTYIRNGSLALLSILTLASGPVHARPYRYAAVVDNQGPFDVFNVQSARPMNDSGEVTFWARTAETFAQGMYKQKPDGPLQVIAGSGQFTLNSIQTGSINDGGSVVFHGSPGTSIEGLYVGSGGAVAPVLVEDDPAPQPQWIISGAATINDADTVVARLSRRNFPDQTPGTSSYGYYHISGGSVTPLAETGATYSNVSQHAPALNDSGQAAFMMRAVQDNSYHVLRYNGGGLQTLATGFSGDQQVSMNSAGDVAFVNQDSSQVHVAHAATGVTTTYASTANGFWGITQGSALINDAGRAAFFGIVNEHNGQPVDWSGVYTGPNILTDRVLAHGDEIFGRSVMSITLLGFNNADQVLMRVTLDGADNWQGLVVATPLLEADFNEDRNVDALDLAIWKTGFGSAASHNQGDADGDGDADGGDFLLWQRQLTPSAAAIAAPEPDPLALLAVVMLAKRKRSTPRRLHGAGRLRPFAADSRSSQPVAPASLGR